MPSSQLVNGDQTAYNKEQIIEYERQDYVKIGEPQDLKRCYMSRLQRTTKVVTKFKWVHRNCYAWLR